MLIAWATLHSLDRVRRNVTSRPDLFTLVWKIDSPSDGKEPQSKPWTLNLLITKGRHEDCLGALVLSMQNLGVGIKRVTKNNAKIKESEVTKEAIA